MIILMVLHQKLIKNKANKTEKVKMQKKLEKVHTQAGVAGIEQLLNFYASEK